VPNLEELAATIGWGAQDVLEKASRRTSHEEQLADVAAQVSKVWKQTFSDLKGYLPPVSPVVLQHVCCDKRRIANKSRRGRRVGHEDRAKERLALYRQMAKNPRLGVRNQALKRPKQGR
jgi:hypothetical protein